MKKQLVVFALLLNTVSVSVRAEVCDFSDDTEKMIRESSVVILDRAASEKQMQDALIRLLDAAIQTLAQSAKTAESVSNLKAARAEFKDHSMLSQTAYRQLSQAYRALNAGKDFQFPPVGSIDGARTHIQKLLDASVDSLNNGQSELSSRLLLESVIMVVTPISK